MNDASHHTKKIKVRMHALISHLRADISKVAEPKAQALFETSAEVLTGLAKAFSDYEKRSELAWRATPVAARSKRKTTHAPRR